MLTSTSLSQSTDEALNNPINWNKTSSLLDNTEHGNAYYLTNLLLSNIVRFFIREKIENQTKVILNSSSTKGDRILVGWVDNAKILTQSEFIQRLRENLSK